MGVVFVLFALDRFEDGMGVGRLGQFVGFLVDLLHRVIDPRQREAS